MQSSVTDERFQLESKLTTLQDTSATAIAAANAVQMDLTARVNKTMARVDELETELHSEQSQVANLKDSLTQSAERSKASFIIYPGIVFCAFEHCNFKNKLREQQQVRQPHPLIFKQSGIV
jgi:seryl-tRNA synthetase